MGEYTIEIGAAIVAAFWIVREIFSLLQLKRAIHKIGKDIGFIKLQTADLYNWHNAVDEDGVKVWYVRRSLEDAIKVLAENIKEQTKVLQACVNEITIMRGKE